jgi:hypothetical protein
MGDSSRIEHMDDSGAGAAKGVGGVGGVEGSAATMEETGDAVADAAFALMAAGWRR